MPPSQVVEVALRMQSDCSLGSTGRRISSNRDRGTEVTVEIVEVASEATAATARLVEARATTTTVARGRRFPLLQLLRDRARVVASPLGEALSARGRGQ